MPRINRLTGEIAQRRMEWLDSRLISQDCSSGSCRVVLSDGSVVAERGANDIIADGGSWAAWLAGFGVFGNTLGHLPDAGIHDMQTKGREASPDGAIAYKPVRNSFGPWAVRERDGSEWVIEGDVQSICLLGNRTAVWKEGNRLHYNGALPIDLPVGAVYAWSACVADGRVAVLYQSAVDGSLVLNGRRIAPPSDKYFYPDVAFLNGRYLVAWSPNQADVDPQTISLTPAQLDLLPSVDAPQPDPETPEDSTMTVRPLPYKTWIAPFYSHSERYGDTPIAQHAGNAIMLAENQGDPDGLRKDLERVYPLATPLIVQGNNAYDDKFLNLTIAWWAAGANADELGASVTAMLTRPEKPIVAYLDKGTADDWPVARPAWVTDRVWPSAQAYRNPGESLLMFEARVTAMLERLATYGVYLGLTPAFFDRNGAIPVAEVLECMPLYDKWLRNYPIVVFQPFADRRPGGMSTHADLKAWATAFNNANYARPNRFDYWLSAGTDINTVLKNKLGQTVALVSLSPTEKKYLLGLMDKPPDPPSDDPPSTEWPNLLDDLRAERAKFPDAMLPADAGGAILNAVAWKHRDQGFCLLSKDSGNFAVQPHTGRKISTDWLMNWKYKCGRDVLIGTGNAEDGTLGQTQPTWDVGLPWDLERRVDPVQP